jgi:hypothetical protein
MIECPKCKAETEPCGSHEDDAGERECDECGFRFVVEIEYDPSYSTSCVEHEYGEFGVCGSGRVSARFCKHCQKCQLAD